MKVRGLIALVQTLSEARRLTSGSPSSEMNVGSARTGRCRCRTSTTKSSTRGDASEFLRAVEGSWAFESRAPSGLAVSATSS